MTDNGIYQTIRDRAQQADIGHVHPHQFRHSFAHAWLAAGGNEGDLMRLTGWRSREMVTAHTRIRAARAAEADLAPPA